MQEGLTRREALKRGAVLAGGLAWATPVVQVIGMSPAYAEETSPGEKVDCCFDPDGGRVKLKSITMRYLGGGEFCTESDPAEALVSCADFPSPPSLANPLPDPAYIVASHQESPFKADGSFTPAARIWFANVVSANGLVVMEATNATETELRGETWVHVFSEDPATSELSLAENYRQKLGIHTSCSDPLFTGDQFGSLVFVGCEHADDEAESTEELESETTDTTVDETTGTTASDTTETTEAGADTSSTTTTTEAKPGNGPPEDPGPRENTGPPTDEEGSG